MFNFTFNGVTTATKGLAVETRPSIPAPQPRGDYVQVAGRDGELLVTDGTYNNIEIQVPLSFISYARNDQGVGSKYRLAKAWLNGAGTLSFSDDTDVFYKVKACYVSSYERFLYAGKLVASFVCDPFTYLVSGTEPVTFTGSRNFRNSYVAARPVIKLTGNGTCTLTLRSKTLTAVVGQNLTIDVDRMIAYRQDGTVMNTSVTGDLENLIFLPGNNNLSVSSGFTAEVKPNWRAL